MLFFSKRDLSKSSWLHLASRWFHVVPLGFHLIPFMLNFWLQVDPICPEADPDRVPESFQMRALSCPGASWRS